MQGTWGTQAPVLEQKMGIRPTRPWRYRVTLCIAAICQQNRRDRLIIATDWKSSTGEAGAENQDKLKWITDNLPALLAGTVSRAIELRDTYRQYIEALANRTPSVRITHLNVADIMRKPPILFKEKLVEEYIGLKFGLTYKGFREAVAKREIPEAIATEAYTDIENIDLDCCLIIPIYIDKDAYIFKVDSDGGVERCDNFAAIGSGSSIAEATLFQRKQEDRMTLGRSVYHVYEAMKLGSIASDVGQEHTIDLVYRPGEKGATVVLETTSDKADRFLAAKFKKLGHTPFTKMPLPNRFWTADVPG